MINQLYALNENRMLDLAAGLANAVIAASPGGGIIFLQGSLGAGKTTFTRGFLRGVGYKNKVKSPTYTLVEPYEIAGLEIFHFDLYRLQAAQELEHMGIREYFSGNAICLIEWPEKGFPLLPPPDLVCDIQFAELGRTISLEAHSAIGKMILSKLSFNYAK
jgi:tRNA threonylcarbamoyladenosine biosynthesis protein TsaE